MTEVKKLKRKAVQMVGRDLELDCVKKVHRQLDRLPDIKAAIRVLGYITAVTHEGSMVYAKQLNLPGNEPRDLQPGINFGLPQ
jgi:hypothetical protein